MRVLRLTVENFRGFERLELGLDRPVTVLVGANGSGKTSVLEAIIVGLRDLVPGGSPTVLSPDLSARDLRRGAPRCEIKLEVTHGGASYTLNERYPASEDDRGPRNWGEQRFFYEVARAPLFTFLIQTTRHMIDASVRAASVPLSVDDDHTTLAARAGYARFVEWFKEREDVENERRIAARSFELQDPQLRAVREAVAALMPGFDNLRIQRDPSPVMVVTKADVELRLDQLSDGERNLIALAGDLARRMVLANPNSDAPRVTEGVVMLDEVEQHLHPAWQRRVIPALQRAFPAVQWIVTTHSPQVLSSVPASAIVVLGERGAQGVGAATEGRDTNAILRDVFGVPERPEGTRDEVQAITTLIDEAKLDEARHRLAQLAARLSEHDDAVLHLRTKLDFAEVGL